ncbi:hypothetical protein OL599_17635 [Rhodovastum sp. RN2-1]|uniref:Uncharacterized protein n=1 Tax=Limobrevibacterium gyesilva TaxID=2991712 RepID=A0AA41YPW6_9PROT|nr:hypothetical protein [Limobrevibacterium gyesilva]MCW3476392.1 hypothetical protein [Limobrevibacterium gyesilva]
MTDAAAGRATKCKTDVPLNVGQPVATTCMWHRNPGKLLAEDLTRAGVGAAAEAPHGQGNDHLPTLPGKIRKLASVSTVNTTRALLAKRADGRFGPRDSSDGDPIGFGTNSIGNQLIRHEREDGFQG